MKILHLLYESRGDYFGIGGVGIRAYEIYRYLKERHDITLLCKKYLRAKDKEIEGLRHLFVGTESKSLTKTLLSYAYQAARFVKKYGNNYDIIIEEFSPAIPTFLNFYKKRPVVLQIQGYTGRQYFEKYNLAYALILYVLEHLRPRFYENFIFISMETGKRLLLENPPIPPLEKVGKGGFFSLKNNKRIEVIPNGIPPELLNTSPEEIDYILYLGRIDIHHKGLDILLDAYREFYNIFPNIRLVMAGDGRDREKLLALLWGLPEGLQQKIELKGWVDGEKKADLLKNALMVVMPSRYETQGIVALEAMACGKAVVVSDIPELSYMIQSKAGTSFKVGNALSLSNSMKDLMARNDRKEMGLRGREWVKDFTWDKVALKYEKFLVDVLEKYKT